MITSITDLMEDSLQWHSLLASQIPEDFPFRTQAAVQPLSPIAHLPPITIRNTGHRATAIAKSAPVTNNN